MKPCVLVAAPPAACTRLGEELRGSFAVMTCVDPGRAKLMVEIGGFQAVVTVADFLPEGLGPVLRVDDAIEPARLLDEVTAFVERQRSDERQGAAELVELSMIGYEEYIGLVRFRATRRYLLGLMHRYRGSVTDASAGAGIVRESLHRLLRRHDIDAEAFRDR